MLINELAISITSARAIAISSGVIGLGFFPSAFLSQSEMYLYDNLEHLKGIISV